MSAYKNWMRKPLGFSLLELMVVVAILGILATVAVPRFNIFRARARQAEAKTNLGVIFTLQESFSIEYESYYDGDKVKWGGSDMKDLSSSDGYHKGVGAGSCGVNKLGFRLANCGKARYSYWMAGGRENDFLAISYAPSDITAGKRIFPGCNGTLVSRDARQPADGVATSAVNPCVDPAGVAGATDVTKPAGGEGDAWCMDHGRNLDNYWDIVEGCDN